MNLRKLSLQLACEPQSFNTLGRVHTHLQDSSLRCMDKYGQIELSSNTEVKPTFTFCLATLRPIIQVEDPILSHPTN